MRLKNKQKHTKKKHFFVVVKLVYEVKQQNDSPQCFSNGIGEGRGQCVGMTPKMNV